MKVVSQSKAELTAQKKTKPKLFRLKKLDSRILIQIKKSFG